MTIKATFKLDDKFIDKYKTIKPNFGFNGLGEVVYLRTYSRLLDDGTNEQWHQTIRRVVEGTYRMQERHILSQNLGWSEQRAQKSAQEMYERMFCFKFLPPGRGLQVMGSSLVEEKGLFAALNSCAFVSSENIDKELSEPFCFMMDAAMLGIGVGFDTKGAGKLLIHKPNIRNTVSVFNVPDSREGWVQSLQLLLDSYFIPNKDQVLLSYNLIREAGEPIRGFGGISSGPGPLIKLHEQVNKVLDNRIGEHLTVRDIVDIMNMIGMCVVSGGARRTAQIALGNDTEEYLMLKDYSWNPDTQQTEGPMVERASFGWVSNNSVFSTVGMNYNLVAHQTSLNGEPGYMWLDNAKAFGRMKDSERNFQDKNAAGGNPCQEQTLHNYEVCTLVETFPDKHESLQDYLRTLKFAYLYAKTVTLGKTPWVKTNRVMQKNRRIGTSISGVAQFLSHHSIEEFRQWLEAGYDKIKFYDKKYSDWLGIPQSIKVTSVKPSGCRPWNSLTTTNQGLLTLQELFENHHEDQEWDNLENVTINNGIEGTNRATKTYSNGLSSTITVKTSYNLVLTATPEHKWYVTREYNRQITSKYLEINKWVATKDLRPGYIIDVLPGAYTNTGHSEKLLHLNSIALKMREDAEHIKQPDILSVDLCWLLGYLWGDEGLSTTCLFIDTRKGILEKVQKILLQEFGLTGNMRQSAQIKNAYILDIGSKVLGHWISKNGFLKYFNRRLELIPTPIRKSSEEHILAFIAGLVDADGCASRVGNYNTLILSTADGDFAKHIQEVCLAVGLVFNRSNTTKGDNFQNIKSVWLMSLAPQTKQRTLCSFSQTFK